MANVTLTTLPLYVVVGLVAGAISVARVVNVAPPTVSLPVLGEVVSGAVVADMLFGVRDVSIAGSCALLVVGGTDVTLFEYICDSVEVIGA